MKYTSITLDQKDRVATVTLSRPERRNALDDVMIRELTDAFLTINRDPATRIAVLTGGKNSAGWTSDTSVESLNSASAKSGGREICSRCSDDPP